MLLVGWMRCDLSRRVAAGERSTELAGSRMKARAGMTSAAAVLVAAACAASLGQAAVASGARAGPRSCVPAEPGKATVLLDHVPGLASAPMTATPDGGAVIAFWSYEGSRGLPRSRFTVLSLNSSGCVRWRASLPGPWPIALPLQADAKSIVVASGTMGTGPLRVYTLSAATGRVLRRD